MINELARHKRFYFFYFLLILVLTLIFTWPLILDLNGSIYGYSGDSFGFIYYLWWWRDNLGKINPLRLNPLAEAPFGSIVPAETGNVVFFWPTQFLALLFGEVVSYNLNLLLTFPFSAAATFLLVFEMTHSRLSALVFSLVFAFSPYHFWKSYNHLDLAMIQYIPFFLWALLRLIKYKSWRESVTAGLSLALLVLLNFYYGFFAILTSIVFFLLSLIKDLIRLGQKSPPRVILRSVVIYSLAMVVAFLITLPFTAPVLVSSVSTDKVLAGTKEVYSRPLDNLLLLSNRPWSFVLPSVDSSFLGSLSQKSYAAIEQLSNDFKTKTPFPHETTVFLGYFSIIFFLFSLFLLGVGKIKNVLLPVILFAVILLSVTSLPPFLIVKGVTFYLPSYFLHQIFPMFRSYGRLGIFVLPLVAASASLSFAYLIEKLKPKQKGLLVFVSIIFILFEFTNIPPFRVTSFAKAPPSYQWLKEKAGDSIVLEYPKNFNLADGEIFQRYHLKKTANFHSASPYFNLWNYLEDIYDPETYRVLSALGVRYVVFHKKLLFENPNPVDELWPQRAFSDGLDYTKLPEAIKIVGDFPEADIFEIGLLTTPKIIVLTKNSLGAVKIDIVGGGTWNIERPSSLYVINLTLEPFPAFLEDGKERKFVEVGVGKSVYSYNSGLYQINLTPYEN